MAAFDERHIYTLMTHDAEVGVAMTCVGVLGIERTGETWSTSVDWIEGFLDESDGGWPDRLGTVLIERSLTLADIEELQELSNGIVWDIWEIDPNDYAQAVSLADAVDLIMMEVLETTAEPIEALRAAGEARLEAGESA